MQVNSLTELIDILEKNKNTRFMLKNKDGSVSEVDAIISKTSATITLDKTKTTILRYARIGSDILVDGFDYPLRNDGFRYKNSGRTLHTLDYKLDGRLTFGVFDTLSRGGEPTEDIYTVTGSQLLHELKASLGLQSSQQKHLKNFFTAFECVAQWNNINTGQCIHLYIRKSKLDLLHKDGHLILRTVNLYNNCCGLGLEGKNGLKGEANILYAKTEEALSSGSQFRVIHVAGLLLVLPYSRSPGLSGNQMTSSNHQLLKSGLSYKEAIEFAGEIHAQAK